MVEKSTKSVNDNIVRFCLFLTITSGKFDHRIFENLSRPTVAEAFLAPQMAEKYGS
jgi:hypothetical protein